jgi:putative two-component system response regulator
VNGSGLVLVVDDEEPIRRMLARLLTRAGYECRQAGDVAEAIGVLATQEAALVLCDVNMPGDSGLRLVEHLSIASPDTAVVMVTAVDDPTVAQPAIELGAYGYVIKPFVENEILINVSGALRRRRLEIENRDHRDRLEALVDTRTAELRAAHEEAIHRLALASEYHDPTTGEHLTRMSDMSARLAAGLGLAPDEVERLRLASPMHDVGKIGVPDALLRKPGPLTPDETTVMRAHTEIGWQLLGSSPSALVRLGGLISLTHHERWDGGGYPRGIAGDDIPIEGRIVAVSDVFDALTTARPYKRAWSVDEALAHMVAERGRHFDGDVVDRLVVEVAAASLG